jgi:hypothetical protein
MRVGYFTMPLHPAGADSGRTMADDIEQLGFEEACVAQALGLTRQIKLGPGVSCLPNHNQLMPAQRLAQLDQMARVGSCRRSRSRASPGSRTRWSWRASAATSR